MVHTSSAGDVASTMECTRGLRRTSVHTPYGLPMPGGSHRRCRSAVGETAPAHRTRAWSAPARHAHMRVSLGTPTVPAPRVAYTAPETSRSPGSTNPLPPTPLAPPAIDTPGLPGLPPNRVLIRFQPELSPETRRAMLCEAGAQVREEFAGGELLIDFDPTAAGSAAARRLAGSAAVALCRRVTVIAVGFEEEVEVSRTGQQRTAVAATAPTHGG
jgi:hypothetical protein